MSNQISPELRAQLLQLAPDGLPRTWFEADVPRSSSLALGDEPEILLQEGADDYSELGMEELRSLALTCRKCRLCEERKQVVFGVGNTNSPQIMFVGEGPGADEDRLGEPFVGRAGQLLTAAITKGMGMKREDIYIANVVKCRPPENRAPLPDETSACTPYLFRQIELIKPKIIVTLGQPAQMSLSGVNLGITKLRGKWQSWRGTRLMPTFHPAYILRNPAAKKEFWEDLQAVMAALTRTSSEADSLE